MVPLKERPELNKTADLDGLVSHISYGDVGPVEGTPVVFILGLGGHRYFAAALEAWAVKQGIRMIVPDRPNKGLTTKQPRQQATVAHFSTALHELLSYLAIPCATLLGHSLGCIYALDFASKHPSQASALYLISPWLGRDCPHQAKSSGALRGSPGWVDGVAAGMSRFMVRMILSSEWALRRFGGHSKREMEFVEKAGEGGFNIRDVRAAMDEEAPGGIESDMVLATEKYQEFGLQYQRVQGMVVVFHGDKDHLTSAAGAQWLKEQLPHSEFVSIVGGSHDLLFDEQVLDQIADRTRAAS